MTEELVMSELGPGEGVDPDETGKSFEITWETESGEPRGTTVTFLGGPSLPIACQRPYKKLKIRNVCIRPAIPASESAASTHEVAFNPPAA